MAEQCDWLQQLEDEIEAEDREDRLEQERRRRLGLPEPPRDVKAFEGFADSATIARDA